MNETHRYERVSKKIRFTHASTASPFHQISSDGLRIPSVKTEEGDSVVGALQDDKCSPPSLPPSLPVALSFYLSRTSFTVASNKAIK